MRIAKVSAGRGGSWINQAMKLVTDRPAVWIGGTTVIFVLTLLLNLIPIIGWLINHVLQFLIVILAFSFAQAQIRGVEFDLDATLQQTKNRLARLILMMIINALGLIICALPVLGALVAAGGMEFLMQNQSQRPEFSLTSTLIVGFGGMISGIASVVVFAATAFTTPLIFFQDQSIQNALRLSLKAVRNNLGALLVFALLMALFLLICMIPLGLGLIFGLPTALASFYVIYEELLGKVESL